MLVAARVQIRSCSFIPRVSYRLVFLSARSKAQVYLLDATKQGDMLSLRAESVLKEIAPKHSCFTYWKEMYHLSGRITPSTGIYHRLLRTGAVLLPVQLLPIIEVSID